MIQFIWNSEKSETIGIENRSVVTMSLRQGKELVTEGQDEYFGVMEWWYIFIMVVVTEEKTTPKNTKLVFVKTHKLYTKMGKFYCM